MDAFTRVVAMRVDSSVRIRWRWRVTSRGRDVAIARAISRRVTTTWTRVVDAMWTRASTRVVVAVDGRDARSTRARARGRRRVARARADDAFVDLAATHERELREMRRMFEEKLAAVMEQGSERERETAQAVTDAFEFLLTASETRERALEEELRRVVLREETRLAALEVEMGERLRAAERIGVLRARGVGGEAALAEARARAEVLELTLDEFEKDAVEAISALEERVDDLETKLRAREEELREANERVDELLTDLAAPTAREDVALAVREAEMAARVALDAAIDEFMRERETLERRLMQLEADMDERALLSMHQMDELRVAFARKEAKLKQDVEKLRLASSDSEHIMRMKESSKEDYSKLEQEVAVCEIEKSELLQEISRLRERLRAVDAE